jgi:hypothetical protein
MCSVRALARISPHPPDPSSQPARPNPHAPDPSPEPKEGECLAQTGGKRCQVPFFFTHKCASWARVLAGNPATIGKGNGVGGLSGDTVGDFPVRAGSAAIALSQWPALTKSDLRATYNGGTQITGTSCFHLPLDLTRPNAAAAFSFTGVTDIIGPRQLSNNYLTDSRALYS